MKRASARIICLACSMSLIFGSGIIVAHSNLSDTQEVKAIYSPSRTFTNHDGDTYYNSISSTATGTTLLNALRTLNGNKRQHTVSYSGMGTSSSTSAYVYTDYLPGSQTSLDSNGQVYGTTITSFYSGNGMTSWNREHVWPDSRGGNSVEADIHMPRPTIPDENGSRGNSFYVEGKKSSSAGWDPAMESFGDSTYRGDSARIIFYCVVASSNLSLIDAESDSTGNKTMGKLSDLLKWNIENPVTQRELNRNEGAEYLQGNRNPFIDHPEYACKIWGDTNDATRKICQNDPSGSTTKTLTGISVTLDDGSSTNTGVYVDVDSYVQLKVTANYDDGTTADVTNSSSYSTTANNTNYGSHYSVSNGKITGLAETSYAAITVSYSTISTVRNIYVTAKGTGNGTPIGSGTDDPTGDFSATYTVSGTSSVTTTGTVPSDSTADYSQTYNTAKQITNGNSATLTLSNYTGKIIKGITLNMNSNSSKGAGSFTATAGSTTLASLENKTFNNWYDNTSYTSSYTDIHATLTNSNYTIKQNEDITLTISATTNSLYINSYTISYSNPGSSQTATLSSIAVSNPKTSYTQNDTFVKPTVTATYSDNSTKNVTNQASFSGYNLANTGNQTVNVSYTEGGVTKTTSYNITVSASAQPSVAETYVLTSSTTTYSATTDWENDVNGFDSSILRVDTNVNVRQGGSASNGGGSAGGTSDFMFMTNSSGTSTLKMSLINTNYIFSKVSLLACKNKSSESPTATCGGLTRNITSLSSFETISFYPLQNSYTITVPGDRIFVKSITLSVLPKDQENIGFGIAFKELTNSECASQNGISTTTWNECQVIYNNLSENGQLDVATYTANPNGDDCAEAMARYENIVRKYNRSDFMNRGVNANSMNVLLKDNSLLIIVISILFTSCGLVACYLLIKKRKRI